MAMAPRQFPLKRDRAGFPPSAANDEPAPDSSVSIGRAGLSVLAVVAICAAAFVLKYLLAGP
jgi:hypothetical protein